MPNEPLTGFHRGTEPWIAAQDLAERVYRLAARFDAEPGKRLAEQLTHAAAQATVAVAQIQEGDAKARLRADAALLEIEALISLAGRLNVLPGQKFHSLLGSIDALRTELKGIAPAPVPAAAPAAPRPAAAPAGSAPTPAPVLRTPPSRAAAPAPPPQPVTPDRLLIDGSNFLGRASGYALGDDASRERFVQRLQDYAQRHPAHKVTVFFDGGQSMTRSIGRVEERVVGGRRTADDSIFDEVRGLPTAERRRCTVISDDRGLASRVRTEGVKVETVSWLVDRLNTPAQEAASDEHIRLNRGEVSEWEAYFNQPPKRPGR